MITIASFDNQVIDTPQPEWFKAERYDYCEKVIREHRQRRHAFFSQLFTSIFKK